nr:hypothetical protein I308_01502 [Cryptococcus tetragattii IND107]
MVSTPHKAHKYSPPPPLPPKHSSSSSSGKNAKQEQPSFSNGRPDQNPATVIGAFSACRNCRNKKVKMPSWSSPSQSKYHFVAIADFTGKSLGESRTLSTMSSIWRVGTVAQETHVDAGEEEDEPIEDDAMQPVPDNEDAESNPYFGPVAGSGVVKALPPIDEVQYPSVKKSTEMIDAFFQEFISVVFAIFALGERAIVTSRAWKREMAKAEGDDDGHETVLPVRQRRV